jgi:hypothetical protein
VRESIGSARKPIASRTALQNIRSARRYVSQQLSHQTFTQKNLQAPKLQSPKDKKINKAKKAQIKLQSPKSTTQKSQNFSKLYQNQKIF